MNTPDIALVVFEVTEHSLIGGQAQRPKVMCNDFAKVVEMRSIWRGDVKVRRASPD